MTSQWILTVIDDIFFSRNAIHNVNNYMPTKDQFEFFKLQFNEEDLRSATLTKRAEIFLSIISLLFTGFIFKIGDLRSLIKANMVLLITVMLILLTIITSAIFILYSIQIKKYIVPFNVKEWENELGDNTLTDKEFFLNRIIDYIVSTPINKNINDKKSKSLQIGGYFLLTGFLLIGIFIMLITVL